MKRIKLIFIAIVLLAFSIVICYAFYKRHKLDEEAKTMLLDVYELEHSYKRMFGTFTKSIHALAFIQDTLITEGGKAHYYVMIKDADDSTFLITAKSVVDFDNDGSYCEWQINEQGELVKALED